MSRKDMIRFSVEMSPELATEFEKISEIESYLKKIDIFTKALFLMHVAIDSKRRGMCWPLWIRKAAR